MYRFNDTMFACVVTVFDSSLHFEVSEEVSGACVRQGLRIGSVTVRVRARRSRGLGV
jgi:hypothetical protein